MEPSNRDRFAKVIAFAPAVFLAHFAEEMPRFVEWFNGRAAPEMARTSFAGINLGVFLVTVVISLMVWFDDSPFSATIALAWLSFLMAANAIVHIAATIDEGAYTPGVVTSLFLYLPYFALAVREARRRGILRLYASTVAVLAAIPMLVQGYHVLFLGSRVF
jgi:Protein of unknown function with HXXEE motif